MLVLDGRCYQLDERARAALREAVNALTRGLSVEIRVMQDMLSTQEAADLLRVSRPTLVKMLEDGLIDFEQPGVHRRVSRSAVDAFIVKRGARRRVGLEAMAKTYSREADNSAEFLETR